MLTAILYILVLLAEPYIPRNVIVPVRITGCITEGDTSSEIVVDEPWIWR